MRSNSCIFKNAYLSISSADDNFCVSNDLYHIATRFNKLFFCKCLHYFGSNEKLKVHGGLRTDERLRYQVSERRRQVAEFQEPLQEGTSSVYCIRRP